MRRARQVSDWQLGARSRRVESRRAKEKMSRRDDSLHDSLDDPGQPGGATELSDRMKSVCRTSRGRMGRGRKVGTSWWCVCEQTRPVGIDHRVSELADGRKKSWKKGAVVARKKRRAGGACRV